MANASKEAQTNRSMSYQLKSYFDALEIDHENIKVKKKKKILDKSMHCSRKRSNNWSKRSLFLKLWQINRVSLQLIARSWLDLIE